jgi:hypothetical protein
MSSNKKWWETVLDVLKKVLEIIGGFIKSLGAWIWIPIGFIVLVMALKPKSNDTSDKQSNNNKNNKVEEDITVTYKPDNTISNNKTDEDNTKKIKEVMGK